MKKSELKQIIKEEIHKVLIESYGGLMSTRGSKSLSAKNTGRDDDVEYKYVSFKGGKLTSSDIDEFLGPNRKYDANKFLEINLVKDIQGNDFETIESVGYLNTDGFIYKLDKKTQLAKIGKLRDSDYSEEEASIFTLDKKKIGVLLHEFYGGQHYLEFDLDHIKDNTIKPTKFI